MGIKRTKRRKVIASHGRRPRRIDKFFEQRCRAIKNEQLIPIIGDAIRISHIFDVNQDDDLGDDGYMEDQENWAPHEESDDVFYAEDDNYDLLYAEDEIEDYPDDPYDDIDFENLNVIEELAHKWAGEVEYPMSDRSRIARVAQFHKLEEESPVTAKENYLSFLKRNLIKIAYQSAKREGDVEEIAFIKQLYYEDDLSFSDIVTELDYPRFTKEQEDPLGLLARLPLKIYLTTSYYNFIERELEAAGKYPKSRMCFWNGRPQNLAREHTPNPNYIPDRNHPVVYHLFGMEQYPQSLVLTEDDYLDYLWAMARDLPGARHSGKSILPPYFEGALNNSSLLLLGYRLGDWDMRVLFRSLLNSGNGSIERRLPSTAIQIDLKDQMRVEDEERAEIYLKRYFKQVKVDVRFGDSDKFVMDLWNAWQRRYQGAR